MISHRRLIMQGMLECLQTKGRSCGKQITEQRTGLTGYKFQNSKGGLAEYKYPLMISATSSLSDLKRNDFQEALVLEMHITENLVIQKQKSSVLISVEGTHAGEYCLSD